MILPGVKRVFLTGGAGFIGSHVVDILAPTGVDVTIYDNLSNGDLSYIKGHLDRPNVKLIQDDILNHKAVGQAMAGHDLIWHLAANTNIIQSHDHPAHDLNAGVIGTFNVLDGMRANGIRDMLFASSGAVYGDLCRDVAVSEDAGPLLPVSPYGAGKVGCEAFISSFCNVYGMQAWMYRFGNVIGGRMTHGIIFDFLERLSKDTSNLLIRGDGRQEKNYFLVEECIDGMAYGFRHFKPTEDAPCGIFNLGTPTISRVVDIARIVVEEIGLADTTEIRIEGVKRAWPGDQPRVHFTVDKMSKLGWNSRKSSDESVRIAIRRMLKKPGADAFVV